MKMEKTEQTRGVLRRLLGNSGVGNISTLKRTKVRAPSKGLEVKGGSPMLGGPMKKVLAQLLWIGVGLVGAWAYLTLALKRGEHINSIYILVAALCSYVIGYRFY